MRLLRGKPRTFTILYRVIIISGLYRWSLHRPFCKAARSAGLAAVTIGLESVSTRFIAFVIVSRHILKKSAENDFLQIEEATD